MRRHPPPQPLSKAMLIELGEVKAHANRYPHTQTSRQIKHSQICPSQEEAMDIMRTSRTIQTTICITISTCKPSRTTCTSLSRIIVRGTSRRRTPANHEISNRTTTSRGRSTNRKAQTTPQISQARDPASRPLQARQRQPTIQMASTRVKSAIVCNS